MARVAGRAEASGAIDGSHHMADSQPSYRTLAPGQGAGRRRRGGDVMSPVNGARRFSATGNPCHATQGRSAAQAQALRGELETGRGQSGAEGVAGAHHGGAVDPLDGQLAERAGMYGIGPVSYTHL